MIETLVLIESIGKSSLLVNLTALFLVCVEEGKVQILWCEIHVHHHDDSVISSYYLLGPCPTSRIGPLHSGTGSHRLCIVQLDLQNLGVMTQLCLLSFNDLLQIISS